ncbi:MAG: GNAT family N-acetyltransferase [Aestuariivirga sp.]|uniref:GNAT family N-acetyltransferase n=1 Tax=Aestuariivirga sp. TaxID=2650926 RepID=UPI0038CFC570
METDLSYSIRRLTTEDGPHLEILRRAYAAEMCDAEDEGEPNGFAATLLSEPNVHGWGAFINGNLVAFAIVFRLPEAISGRWCGLLDDLFVAPDARRQGIAQDLLDTVANYGKEQCWTHLRWLVPENDMPAIALYERVAEEAPWRSFMICY